MSSKNDKISESATVSENWFASEPIQGLRTALCYGFGSPYARQVEKMPTVNPVKRICMIVLLAMGCISGVGAQLPPEMQADRLVVRAERQAREGEPAAALASLDDALALRIENSVEIPVDFWFRHAVLARIVGDHTRAVESATRYVTAAGSDAEHYLAALEILDSSELDLESLAREQEAQEAAERARREVEARAFSDPLVSGGYGPEMIEIPGGEFLIGCHWDCYGGDRALQRVSIQRFALSRHEVTFSEWDACVGGGGCGGYSPDDRGWGRGTRPVINVSWEDAQAYVSWLSAQTGEQYRLPSSSEWEYAARAGTETKYSWGDDVGYGMANCDSTSLFGGESSCGSRWDGVQTAPVGSFEPNGYGLYDVHGNVWEWVEDCNSFENVPSDGSAFLTEDCRWRAYRGGAWDDPPSLMRSMLQMGDYPQERSYDLGFRVARTLAP